MDGTPQEWMAVVVLVALLPAAAFAYAAVDDHAAALDALQPPSAAVAFSDHAAASACANATNSTAVTPAARA